MRNETLKYAQCYTFWGCQTFRRCFLCYTVPTCIIICCSSVDNKPEGFHPFDYRFWKQICILLILTISLFLISYLVFKLNTYFPSSGNIIRDACLVVDTGGTKQPYTFKFVWVSVKTNDNIIFTVHWMRVHLPYLQCKSNVMYEDHCRVQL